jgi:hypothetical protein
MIGPAEMENKREFVEDYFMSQSPASTSIRHIELLTTEIVLGRPMDVWDVHADDGRWWVISGPMNLYPQDTVPSKDVALTLHIGLNARIEALSDANSDSIAIPGWLLPIQRQLIAATRRLESANETEDFLAVGVQCRELIHLTARQLRAELALAPDDSIKGDDTKEWMRMVSMALFPGRRGARRRSHYNDMTAAALNLANQLAHGRHSTRLDSLLCHASTAHFVNMVVSAVHADYPPEPCPACGSIKTWEDRDSEGTTIRRCSACGEILSRADVEADTNNSNRTSSPMDKEIPAEIDLDECESADLSNFFLKQTKSEIVEREPGDPAEWVNRYADFVHDRSLWDAHRLYVLKYGSGHVEPYDELVYSCGNDSCMNPDHFIGQDLSESRWVQGIVLSVRPQMQTLELTLGLARGPVLMVTIPRSVISDQGFADYTSLLERLVFIGATAQGTPHGIVFAHRRTSLQLSSVVPIGSARPMPGADG